MKYRILKILDVTGFTFLRPVVLLCAGEEPGKQLNEIGRFIVIPIFAIIGALLLWNWLAPLHKTKSGEVPTPFVVWDAAQSVWTFHYREGDKRLAYQAEGASREQQIQAAQERLVELESLAKTADAQVEDAESGKEEEIQAALEPVKKLYSLKQAVFEKRSRKRLALLAAVAKKLPPNDLKMREAFLKEMRKHQDLVENERNELTEIKSRETDIRTRQFPESETARKAQSAIAEERQYLLSKLDVLSNGSRSVKATEARQRIIDNLKRFNAAQGDEIVALAGTIVSDQQRLESIRESEYAKPWTLPDQILRSLACVFFGFLLGSAIAIPIGVLCGLSETFMAAVTPFIALLKPVSPIVWLPVTVIIVGGFITDPDKHWLINGLEYLPLIGWMKINPAFIASGVTVALCSLWPTLVNTALGVASIDQDHVNVARVLRLGFWTRLTKIVIPSALPLIFAGLRISLSVGWMVLVAAELLSSSEGIGKFVWDQFNNGASDSFAKMILAVFVVGALGFLLDRIMIVLQRSVSFDGAPAAI